jgi:UDP-N-acetylglucosamine 2-epimerase (non-hydrolysing)
LPEKRRVAVLTTGRQDFGILRSTIHALHRDARFELLVWAGGMHLSAKHGHTIDILREDGVPVDRELDFMREGAGPPTEAARALELISAALEEARPDLLLLLGDRSETAAAALAATMEGIPIAHLHGGEETEGAIDNVLRHAITKLSHLHLVSHARHAMRVLQMGEDPDRVIVVGLAGLDNLYRADIPGRERLVADLGHELTDPLVLVTMHPTTLAGPASLEVESVAAAMEMVDATYLITTPNSDRGGHEIREFWERWCEGRRNAMLVSALGELNYFAALRLSRAVVGNSSSGILEAPAVGVPVVNVGDRQLGRLRYGAIRDVPPDAEMIAAALRDALAGHIVDQQIEAPYLPGPAAPRIVEALAGWNLTRFARKTFVTWAYGPPA